MVGAKTAARRSRRLGVISAAAALAVAMMGISACSTSTDAGSTDAGSTDAGSSGEGSSSALSAAPGSPRALLPERIVKQGYVTVVADTSFGPPWIFNPDDAPDTFDGIDPSLGRAIFTDVLGVDVKFVKLPFDGVIPGLRAGRYDLALNGMSDTAEREKQLNMIHYVDDAHTLVVAAGNPLNIGSMADLCGKTVAVVTGTQEAELAEKQADQCQNGMTVSKFPSTGAVYLAIKSKRADATVNGYAAAVYQDTHKVAGFDGLEALQDVRIGANPLGIAVPKSDPELANAIVAALKQMTADGSYQRILKDWNVESGALAEPVLNAQSQ